MGNVVENGVVDYEAAFEQYVETAIWASSELDDGEWTPEDIDQESLAAMRVDLDAFIDGCLEHRPDVFDGLDSGGIGHDFWLTRNGRGVGFWDRGLGERGQWLTTIAEPYGDAYLYVDGDNKIHYYS